MLHSTFISLLVSALAAQGLSLPTVLPANSELPSFALVTPGATIDTPSSTAPKVTPTTTPSRKELDSYNSSIQVLASESCSTTKSSSSQAPKITPTPTPVDEDQPDPYNSTLELPASESFNPVEAPAFTQRPGVPNISNGPVFSTPCSTEITPTAVPDYPAQVPSHASPTKTPTPKVPSVGKATPASSSAAPPAKTPSDEEKTSKSTASSTATSSGTPLPISPSAIPTGGRPATFLSEFPTSITPISTRSTQSTETGFPTSIPCPSDRPAYGYGRPRPTGAWPSRARPSRAFSRLHRPSAVTQLPSPSADKENAKTTPCTLETRVRPTPTAAVRRRAAGSGAYAWWE